MPTGSKADARVTSPGIHHVHRLLYPVSHSAHRRVYLIDPQPLVREWLTNVLSDETGVTVCGEATGFRAAMRDIGTCNPHAIIMDLALEDGSGFDLIEQMLGRCPKLAVLVLSIHDEVYYADRVLRAGAKGYVCKNEATKTIAAAVRCVLQGKVYLSRAITRNLINRRAGEPASNGARPIESLSDRELEVFAMSGRGFGTRRIADLLHLSPKTIQAYDGRIKDKLHLRDANELIREAIWWVETAGKRNRRTIRLPDDDGIADACDATMLPSHD